MTAVFVNHLVVFVYYIFTHVLLLIVPGIDISTLKLYVCMYWHTTVSSLRWLGFIHSLCLSWQDPIIFLCLPQVNYRGFLYFHSHDPCQRSLSHSPAFQLPNIAFWSVLLRESGMRSRIPHCTPDRRSWRLDEGRNGKGCCESRLDNKINQMMIWGKSIGRVELNEGC